MPDKLHTKLLVAQLSEMADRDRHSTLVGVPAVLTVVWMHMGHMEHSQIFGWMGYMLAVMAARLFIGWRWEPAYLEKGRSRQALNWRLVVSALYGFGWGGAMLVLNTGRLDVLTTFKVGTLTAALGIMLNSMSVIFIVYLAFLVPCWISLLIYIFFFSGFLTTHDSIICGVAAAVFGFILIGASSSIDRLTRQFFLSNFDRDEAHEETRASHQREKELSRQLADQARRDVLTGTYNRRYLMEQLDYQARAYLRTQEPFSVVLIDIDHFKRINDTYGHDTGDIALKGATAVMSQVLRDIDIFGRWGGEEFLCILPRTSSSDTQVCAERLRNTLRGTHFTNAIPDLRVTASFGVATYQADDNADSIVKRADLALYRAKSEGRDRVMADS